MAMHQDIERELRDKVVQLESAHSLLQERYQNMLTYWNDVKNNELCNIDKRIGDLHHQISNLQIGIFISGTLLTIVLMAFGIFSYFGAEKRAEFAAQTQAKTTIWQWLTENNGTLRNKIDQIIISQTENFKAEESKRSKLHTSMLAEQKEEYKKELNKFFSAHGQKYGNKDVIALTPEELKNHSAAVGEIKSRPMKEYTAQDWIVLGIDAFYNKLFALAADYWDKAATAVEKDDVLYASILVIKGVALSRSGENEKAITIFDEIFTRFESNTAPDMRAKLAMALTNKGAVLAKIGDTTKAIAVYDDVIKLFGQDMSPEVMAWAGGALAGKGEALSQMGNAKEAIEVYDEGLKRLDKHATPEIRVVTAIILLNKGVTHGLMGDKEKETAAYEEILKRYTQDTTPGIQNIVEKAKKALKQ